MLSASNAANLEVVVLMGEVLQRADQRGLVVKVVLEADRGQQELVTYEAGEKMDSGQMTDILCEARKSALEIMIALGHKKP